MFRLPRAGADARLFATISALGLASTALAGPIWDTDLGDDAKETPSDAQVVTTNGTVLMIKGRLSGTAFQGGSDFIDMYLVNVTNPAILALSTAGGDQGGGAQFNTQMFLFKAVITGQGRFGLATLANDDIGAGNQGSFIGNTANDASGFVLQEAGLYFLAITTGGLRPLGFTGAPLWEGLEQPGRVAFGGFNAFSNWGGQPTDGGGTYEIRVTGIAGVPAPGAAALLGIAGVFGRRRRREATPRTISRSID